MRAVSLFSGIGALDLAVAEVFGAHSVAFAELDPNASKVLAARWPGVPNVGDVTKVRWEDWEGVDVLHGGPPCQPTSSAGKRLGENDERWMWPAALDALRRVRPRWVVWENPAALLGLGGGVPFGRILGEMASLGYVGSYGCLRASDIGACHQRDRLWIVATDAERAERWPGDERRGRAGQGQHRSGEAAGRPRIGGSVPADADRIEPERRRGLGELAGAPRAGEGSDGQRQRVRSAAGRGGKAPTDADDLGRQGTQPEPWGNHGRGDREATADATDERRERLGDAWGRRGRSADDGGVDWGDYAHAIARHARLAGRPAPPPVLIPFRRGRRIDQRDRSVASMIRQWEYEWDGDRLLPVDWTTHLGHTWDSFPPVLSHRFVEWMQVLPAGWVTDVLPRNPALKALGNCVVPPCAIAAIRQLVARIGTMHGTVSA